MIPISKAFKIVEGLVKKLSIEKVELAKSCGRILAENIFADADLPPFNRSQMDGFAVRTKDVKDAPVKLKVIGESVAGKGFDGKIKRGEAVKIMTGARLPKGADAVQKKESARESDNGKFVEILEATKHGQHFVSKAAEIKKGEKVFSKGEIINAQMIAALASFGCAKVKVFQKPKVTILSTGSEIVSIDKTPKQDQIRDSNLLSLKIFAEKAGADVVVLSLIKDEISDLKLQIAKAIGVEFKVQGSKFKVKNTKSAIQNPKPKILVITGGVSVGDYDFTKPVLRELGAEIFFERVALRPGKPTVFAKLKDTFIFGLPGNPVSAAVTFNLFVRKAILQMQGVNETDLKEGFAILTKQTKGAKERDSYIPAKLSFNENVQTLVEPLRWSGSSDFVAFSKADCLLFVPKDTMLKAETIVRIIFLEK